MSQNEDTHSVRMLAPPHHRRRADVPRWLVEDRLNEGWIVDPFPDRRGERFGKLCDLHKGRPALVVASGPSSGMLANEIREIVKAISPVRWATNDAWRVLAGLPFLADYLVVLDDPFWHAWRQEIEGYLAESNAIPCLSFDPAEESLDYFPLRIGIHKTPETGPPYIVGEFFHGNSSGVAAVQMAMQAGCDPIYLVGHDCGVVAGNTHGFGVRSQDELGAGYSQGKSMLAGYDLLAAHARSIGRSVVNLSPVSLISSLPRSTAKEIIDAANQARRSKGQPEGVSRARSGPPS